MRVINQFRLDGRTAVITGGAGFMGQQHAEVLLQAGARVVLADSDHAALESTADYLENCFPDAAEGMRIIPAHTDITDSVQIQQLRATLSTAGTPCDILINNAALDPKVGATDEESARLLGSRLEVFSEERWAKELAVGLTGAFLCAQAFGSDMATRGSGVILNISSILGLVAPDQRLYCVPGADEVDQPVKPVTYSVIKHGLIGLTRWLATYWAERGVRVNALCPAGMANEQPPEFVARLADKIPMHRMGRYGEYEATVLYMVSDASSYMTGSVVTLDGGLTAW